MALSCAQCAAVFPETLLSCPSCHALVHGAELKRLAAVAQAATTHLEEMQAWRRALELLPPTSQQHRAIYEKVERLAKEIDGGAGAPQAGGQKVESSAGEELRQGKKKGGVAAVLTALVLLATKFKFVIMLVLTKGKLLLLGLTKGSTLFSMLASFGVYWSIWGWKFAAGLLVSIYIHEMGHVAMLRRFGVSATAPMFIPGLGALIRLKERLHTPLEESRVGLAGPMWGLGAALLALGLSWGFDSRLMLVIAKVGALINLFNLTPIWQLDGSHAFRALTRVHRWLAVAAVFGAFGVFREGMLLVVGAVAVYRAFSKDLPAESDPRSLWEYVFLIGTLSALSQLPVPM